MCKKYCINVYNINVSSPKCPCSRTFLVLCIWVSSPYGEETLNRHLSFCVSGFAVAFNTFFSIFSSFIIIVN